MDNNIFSGLEDLGLNGIGNLDIFGAEKAKEEKENAVVTMTPEERELDMLFDKTYTCPVCTHNFKNRTLRTGKAKLLEMKIDLRQKFEFIEPLKYDVVGCPRCGFTAVTKFFVPMTTVQRKNVLEKITANFKQQPETEGLISYETAIGRYKLALANDVVRNAKTSEKAYTCLRAGWLCSSWQESMIESGNVDEAKMATAKALEAEFMKNALEGFNAAVEKERFPMCGMDEGTVDFLRGAIAYNLGQYDLAARTVSKLLTSASANPRMKDKARDLKDAIVAATKA